MNIGTVGSVVKSKMYFALLVLFYLYITISAMHTCIEWWIIIEHHTLAFGCYNYEPCSLSKLYDFVSIMLAQNIGLYHLLRLIDFAIIVYSDSDS